MDNRKLEDRVELLEKSIIRISKYVKRKSNEEIPKNVSPYQGIQPNVFKEISEIFDEIDLPSESKQSDS